MRPWLVQLRAGVPKCANRNVFLSADTRGLKRCTRLESSQNLEKLSYYENQLFLFKVTTPDFARAAILAGTYNENTLAILKL